MFLSGKSRNIHNTETVKIVIKITPAKRYRPYHETYTAPCIAVLHVPYKFSSAFSQVYYLLTADDKF